MAKKGLLGFIAAAAAGIFLLISICILKEHNKMTWTDMSIMVLVSLLIAIVCVLIRLLTVLGVLKSDTKGVASLILLTGLVAGILTIVAFALFIRDIVRHYDLFNVGLSGETWFAFVCVIIAGLALVANLIIGVQEFQEAGASS